MKVKDLIEILLTLNPEAEIGIPDEGTLPRKIINFYEDEGWIEEQNGKENKKN